MQDNIASLLDIERKFRHAKTSHESLVLAVNLLRSQFHYQSAVAFAYNGTFKAIAHSDTPYFESHSPLVKNLRRHLGKMKLNNEVVFESSSVFDSEYEKQGLRHAMILPLVKPSDNRLYGAIVFFSDTPFSPENGFIASHWGEVIAHAMASHNKKLAIRGSSTLKVSVAILGLSAIMSIPIPLNSSAKAQVVPYNPHIVTAPMNGIVKSVYVKSNDNVKVGENLLSYDDIDVRGKQRIAAQTVNISASEIVKQERAAFFDPSIRNKLEESKADRAVKSLEYQSISAQLNKLSIRAREAGTVVLDDPLTLIGKPVKAGEKLLSIVNPNEVEIELMLPAHETHAVHKGDKVSVFLDNAPFDPITGNIDRVMYEPIVSASNIVSYKAYVQIKDNQIPFLGMCGNAKIYGEETSLFWYVFRRPIAFVRWYFG